MDLQNESIPEEGLNQVKTETLKMVRYRAANDKGVQLCKGAQMDITTYRG